MSKITFILPGQGAQTCGIDKDFYEQVEIGKKMSDKASELPGFSTSQLCLEQNDRLNITEYAQATMITTSIATTRVLEERGIKPDVAVGLSPGEYCALAASDMMSAEDTIRTVCQKGVLTQEAVPVGEGAMTAVLVLDAFAIEVVTGAMEGAWVASYNCPGQIVISDRRAAVEEACEELRAAEAGRALILNVSGPFHSGTLTEAGGKLAKVLEGMEIHAPRIPYVANINTEFVTTAEPVEELLTKQVSSSVRRQQNVEATIADGVDTFIEIGPGRTLAGFMKKTGRKAGTLNVGKLKDIDKVVEALQQAEALQ